MAVAVDWSLVVAIIGALCLPIVVNVGALSYYLGGIRAQVRSLSERIDKLETEGKENQQAHMRVDDRIRDLALVVAEMKPVLGDIRSRIDFWHLTQEHRASRKPAHEAD